jgi:nitrogen fixation protein FixH
VFLSATVKPKPPLRDRLIPWYFVMGFVVVLAVNVLFVRVALQSNTGVVTEHAYEKGLAYNRILSEVKEEQALGWKSTIAYADGQLQLSLADSTGKPLSGAKVTAYLKRPLQGEGQQTVELVQAGKAGYVAPLRPLQQGQWDITVSILWNRHYSQLRQRLIVP